MSITINESHLEFHLYNDQISYIFRVLEKSHQLEHLYYGKRIHHRDSFAHLIEREIRPSCNMFEGDHTSSMEHIKQEYPSFGSTDFRFPAHVIMREDGSHITNFVYQDFRVIKGKKSIDHLPATYVEQETEADTLEIDLFDKVLQCQLTLTYTIYQDRNVISRHARFVNIGKEDYFLDQAMSMSLDLPDDQFEMIHLQGGVGKRRPSRKEKIIQRDSIHL
ncbi:glycoside hydrolase family 36 N-terminal domain-containing protein [Gracilibacillus sp. JCM 18860]|uniref:glycoside hydrolase family 36 N-terminal domain-containing protein n=1 Tax=Gracilibacillus sp. JCM 18860 TaxID=1306159 RepID=UPI000A50DE32